MATLMMVALIAGYAWSVWSLKRQEHFDERPRRESRRGLMVVAPRGGEAS